MTTPEHDDDLARLLDDAVSDVEPADRLTAIRARTARRSRRGWYAVGGAALAAAAVVVAVAVVGTGDAPRERPDVATGPTSAPTPPETPPDTPPVTQDVTPTQDPPGPGPGLPTRVYYVGAGPTGPDAPASVLYPEPPADDVGPLAALMRAPRDPDYRTLWPQGSLASYAVAPDRVVVRVSGGPVDDDLARQQLIWTLAQGSAADLPVELEWADGRSGDPIRPVERAPELEVLSHLSITDPAEGATYDGSFTATGLSNGFEASVACWLYVGDDGGAYGPYVGMADGWLEPRLFPWEVRIDLGGRNRVPPGRYSLECTTDDPTGGAEGSGPGVDTRTITVE